MLFDPISETFLVALFEVTTVLSNARYRGVANILTIGCVKIVLVLFVYKNAVYNMKKMQSFRKFNHERKYGRRCQ